MMESGNINTQPGEINYRKGKAIAFVVKASVTNEKKLPHKQHIVENR